VGLGLLGFVLSLSWYFGDSSHGDSLTEGLDGVQRRVRLEIG
jgi:hypothetical protein